MADKEVRKNRVRELRIERGLSGNQVANKLEISSQYYYEIERGDRNITAEITAKLVPIFKATSDYILCISDKNLYKSKAKHKNSPDSIESEPEDLSIDKLNLYKLSYKGHILSESESKDVMQLLKVALKNWKL